MQIETIKINDDNRRGFKIINKHEFDKNTMTVYGEKPKTQKRIYKKTVKDDDDK